MRFTYIDGRGVEVEVPSEAALRLRIELGAIVESTLLHDAERGGGWAPAEQYEPFRRLRQEFRAAAADPHDPATDLHDPAAGGAEPEPEPPATDWMDAGVLPPDWDGAVVDPGVPPDDPPAAFEGLEGFGRLDLHPSGTHEPRFAAPAPESPDTLFEGGEAATAEPDDPWAVPGRDPWAPEETEGPADVSGLDGPAPAPHPDPERDDEPPPPPSWTLGETPHGGGRRAAPPPRPAAAPRRTSVPLLVVGALVVGAGGWYLAQDRAAGPDAVPVVEIPEIAPTLTPVATEASVQATAGAIGALETLPSREAIPDDLDPEWLSGRYMAGASAYPSVRLYWEAVGRYVQVIRAREAEVFAAALDAVLDTIPLAADDRGAVEARSLAGFAAAMRDREAVHGQLRAVADAALRLHSFLEQNEDRIAHDPAASGLSRDPVLEAIPETETLGAEMWNRVAEITSALDALGFLDQVTTDRLLDVYFTKLRSVKVR